MIHTKLDPLKKRTTPHWQMKRALKIEARRTIADVLNREQNTIQFMLASFFQRTFWGRLKWLFTGR